MWYKLLSVRLAMVMLWVSAIIIFLCLPFFTEFVGSDKTINIMSWTELIDPHIIAQFEKESGIKVNVSYFESNEELYARIKATGGVGYDMLVPSDYAIPWLIEDDFLKPLDKTKLTILDRLDPKLLDHYFDPNNSYSLPYLWQLYGLAVDMNAFDNTLPQATWGLLFNRDLVPGYVVMPDVAREVISIAALYLFGRTTDLTDTELDQIYTLLSEQKQWVAAYSEMRADFLLTSGVCSVIVSQSPLMWRITREQENIQFIVPKEGTFVVMDNFVIPKVSSKDEYVYQFINYLYRPENIQHHFETYRFIPATIDLLPLMQQVHGGQSVKDAHLAVTHDITFFKKNIDEKKIKNIWIALKGL